MWLKYCIIHQYKYFNFIAAPSKIAIIMTHYFKQMESWRDHTLLLFWSSIIFLSQNRQHYMMILLSWLNDLSKIKRFCYKGRNIWVNIVHAYTHGRTHSSDVSVHCINKVILLSMHVSFGCEQSEWVTFNEWVMWDTHVFPLYQVKSN